MKDQGSSEWSQRGSSVNECDPVKLPLPPSFLLKGSIGLQKGGRVLSLYKSSDLYLLTVCVHNRLICRKERNPGSYTGKGNSDR